MEAIVTGEPSCARPHLHFTGPNVTSQHAAACQINRMNIVIVYALFLKYECSCGNTQFEFVYLCTRFALQNIPLLYRGYTVHIQGTQKCLFHLLEGCSEVDLCSVYY